MKFHCARCGVQVERLAGQVNRSRRIGMALYCGRRCAGLARRNGKSKAQRVEEKRLYDMEYRAANKELLREKKRKYHKRSYDPEKARVVRQRRMPYHVEYCRRPEYRVKKREYDSRRRAAEYGPFAEAYTHFLSLTKEIKQRSSDYEIRQQNGTFGKRQQRSREAGPQATRDRNRSAHG